MAMEIVMDSLQKLYLVLELIAKSLYCMYISFAAEHSRVVESTLTQVFVSTGKFSKVEITGEHLRSLPSPLITSEV